MLKNEVRREGLFTQIPKYVRKQVLRTHCSLCKLRYNQVVTLPGNKIVFPKQVLHHLISRRFLQEHGIYEHHVSNLISICNREHSKLLRIEDRLFQGDVIGFLTGCKMVGIPPERIIKFALSVGLKEFGGLTI